MPGLSDRGQPIAPATSPGEATQAGVHSRPQANRDRIQMLKLTIGRNIPAAIWVLGLVSLFMDISSEMIHAYLPLFLVNVLGASALTVGVIEGIAEATASITKM